MASEESPVFSYISNLSPIKPDKAAPVAQGFPGINSPPLVFRSPQINPHCQPTFLKRSQCAQLSDAGSSGHDENFEDTITVLDVSGRSTSYLSSGLRTCSQKAFVSNDSPPEKTNCPPECADNYLTLMENMDGGASASSENLTPKSSADIFHSQSDLLESKESEERTRDKDNPRKDEMTIGAPLVILEQAEEDDQRNSVSGLKSVEPDEKSGDGNTQPDICPNVEPDSPVDLDNQRGGHSKAKNVGSGHAFEGGCTSLLGSLQIAQDCGSCHENSEVPCAGLENGMHDHSSKVVQLQHGISRRSLLFEDAQNKTMASFGFQNSSGNAGYPRSPTSPADSEVLELALKKPSSPSNRLLASVTEPTFSPQNSGSYNMKVPKHSGIGLHLNSIVNSMQMGSGAQVSMKSAERRSFDGQGKMSISITSCHLRKNSSVSSNVVDSVSLSSDDSRLESHGSIQASSATPLSPYSMKLFYESVLLKSIELQSNPSNKRKSNSETSDSFEEFSHSSPKIKRKKTLDASDSNGCKRCNCKKTKCLKLYCDCFAAGIYCAEPCACQGCFNRLEYEDTVLETRQQIESRNPLAFASKIIQHGTEAPANICADDGSYLTPSSARHKRGCNCKKSKCLKKYCECYQANVGCSDGCRCEGCENVYGLKEEYSMIKDMASKQDNSESLDSSFDTMVETVAPKDGLLQNDLYHPQNMTPLTPSFQFSNHGKDASKAWFSSGGYLPSPDSRLTFMAPYGISPGPATNPDNHDMILENYTPTMDLVSFDQDIDYGNGHSVNQFTPRCDVPTNAGHFTSLPNQQDWANTSRAQIFPGNHQVSSASSLRWRSSPITQSTHFGATKLHEVVGYDGELYNIMDDDDDDIPAILKETPTLPGAVKVSSPNKKRVSPPHGRGTEIGSSSSAGLKSSRRLILHAIPFPSLTPCIDSIVDAGHNINNSQNSSSGR